MPFNPRFTSRSAALAVAAAAMCSVQAHADSTIKYDVTPLAEQKQVQVAITVDHLSASKDVTVRFQMPVWMPGAYFTGNFATGISGVTAATSTGKALKLTHPDANTWEVGANGANGIKLTYLVNNADVEAVAGVPRRGHIAGPRTYMYVVDRKTSPIRLSLHTPVGAKLWNVATSLDPVGAQVTTTGGTPPATVEYSAPTYDVFADAPIEMGNFLQETFTAAGKPHYVVMYGDYKNVDKAKLTDYCRRVAETETAFFGGAPFERYVFEFACTSLGSRGAGGLEHLGSTEIGTVGTVNDTVRSVIAHEFFHLWNVKRIRPFVLGPFNYVDPPHTANLWWSEGVTSYYGDLLSERGGLNTREEYYKHLSQEITSLQNNPARLAVSADQASLRVWDANNSQGFGGLSYYTKGELVGLCLDLTIRHETNGAHNLDDVMKALFAQVKQGKGPGFEEDDIKRTINRITGKNLSDVYDAFVRSTEELPFDRCLGYAGLKLTRKEPPVKQAETGLRPQFDRTAGGMMVGEVIPGSAAEAAGLKAGDRITSINGNNDRRAIGMAMFASHPGDDLKVEITRGGTPQTLTLKVGSRDVYTYTVEADSAASAAQSAVRDAWLNK